ncbi:MAG: rod shape-determining protein MreC, partial [Chloroflexota bacterium]|nr:rod shape-determining protein MreC [Chloroflexota bacterium]
MMYAPNRNRATLLITLVVIAILALILHQLGQLQPLEDLAFGWMQPLLEGALGVGEGAGNVAGGFADVNALREQVKQLQDQVNGSSINQVRVRELESENAILRQQLGYKQSNPDFDLVGAAVLQRNPDLARVIGQDPSNLVQFIIVDQGGAEGVKVGMPVATPQGLVGRV